MRRNTPPNPWGLSLAQQEYLDALVRLEENKYIARERGVCVSSVEQSLTIAFKKMDVRGRVQAAVKWHEWRKHGNKPE